MMLCIASDENKSIDQRLWQIFKFHRHSDGVVSRFHCQKKNKEEEENAETKNFVIYFQVNLFACLPATYLLSASVYVFSFFCFTQQIGVAFGTLFYISHVFRLLTTGAGRLAGW